MAYRAYQHYRPSDASGTSQVPSHWTVKRLRFAARLNPTDREVKLTPDSVVSFIPMEAVGEWGGLALDSERQLDEIGGGYTYFADGDVVVAKITPCFENGKGALAEGLKNGVAFGTTELHVVRPESELDPEFLFFVTISSHFRDIGESEMYGAGGQKRIPDTFIKDFRIAFPSIDEQREIAAVLKAETARIDQLLAARSRHILLLEENRAATITNAVTRGIDPKATMKRSGLSWFSDLVPSHWDMSVPIKFQVASMGGLTPSTSNAAYWDGSIPWVTPKDMKREVILESEDHITEEALCETSIGTVPLNAVLIVVRGMILSHTFPVAINGLPVTLNQDMKALIPNARLSPRFLAWYLRGVSPYILSLVETSAHGTKALRSDQWNRLIVPVFPFNEQEAIADYVELKVAAIDSLANKLRQQISRLQEYRAALITNAVVGRIDVRARMRKEAAA